MKEYINYPKVEEAIVKTGIKKKKEKKCSDKQCMKYINKCDVLKRDIDSIIYNFKICSLNSDEEYRKMNPFLNDCQSSPSNDRWQLNINVQECAEKADEDLKLLSEVYDLNKNEKKLLYRWKKTKCPKEYSEIYSESQCSKENNCEGNESYKKLMCKELVNELKKNVQLYKYCTYMEDKDDCKTSPTRFKNNDNVKKNKIVYKCKKYLDDHMEKKYKYWQIPKDHKLRLYLDSWSKSKCPSQFVSNVNIETCREIMECSG